MITEARSTETINETQQRVKNISACLIIPPSTFLVNERVFPSLGVLKVAAELQRNGNHVEVLDLSKYSGFEDIAEQYLTTRSDDIKTFGLTTTTPQLPATAKILNKIREIAPDSKVVLGGPHVTLTHAAFVQDIKSGKIGRGTHAFKQLTGMFDQLVVGDGEKAIFRALDPEYKEQIIDAGSLRSNMFIRRGELDNYAFPARELIDIDSYHYQIDGHRAFSVISQLGCPFECGFCGGRDAQSFRMTRTRSIENVINEIGMIVQESRTKGKPLTGVMFYDDELNVVPHALENLCQSLINLQDSLGLEMRFRGFVKAELFAPKQAKLMYAAGFRIVLSGIESGSDEILTAMGKRTSRAINSRCLEFANQENLQFKALMSIGHPGESEKTIKESIDWVLTNKPSDVDWTIITQYPGSPYFDRSEYIPDENAWMYTDPRSGMRLWSRGQVDYTTDAEYYKGIPGDYQSYVWTDFLTSEELVKLRDAAESTTRQNLKLNPITSTSTLQFEHSMGQSLPQNILRKSSKL